MNQAWNVSVIVWTSQIVFFVFFQAWISSEEASILCSLHSCLFTAEQDGPSQSFGEGMENLCCLLLVD